MIRTFVYRCLAFVAVAFTMVCAVSAMHLHVLKKIVTPGHFKIERGAEVIVIGDSHVQTAVDRRRLEGAVNISANSMHYVYSYAVLEKMIAANPQVKAVVLGYSWHNLNEYYDSVLRDKDQARFRLGQYYYLFGPQEKDAVRARTLAYYEAVAKYQFGLPIQMEPKMYLKALFGQLSARDFSFWGKPHVSKLTNLSPRSVELTLLRHFFGPDGRTYQNPSLLQKQYLQKIIGLCRKSGVRLYLLVTPVHLSYSSNIPGVFRQSFDEFTSELKQANPGLDVWDYSQGGPYASFMFGDADHLNEYGARIFTRVLNDRLKEMVTSNKLCKFG